MPDLIVIAGAPGVGKSTVSERLQFLLHGPRIDFGRLREFHLDREWRNQSEGEESMTFDNLLYIVRNYLRHGYSNIILEDLQDHRIQQMPALFPDVDLRIITLVSTDANELRRRIDDRNDGWRDVDGAIAWNQRVIERATVRGEYKLDTAGQSAAQVAADSLKWLEERKAD